MMKSRGRNRGQALSDKMASGGLVRIMATHSPLSARLADSMAFGPRASSSLRFMDLRMSV